MPIRLVPSLRGAPCATKQSYVMPTVAHVGAAYSLGYDVEPYTSMVTRRWFLKEAAEEGWLLVLDHEPGNPCQRVRENGKGWFELVAEERG